MNMGELFEKNSLQQIYQISSTTTESKHGYSLEDLLTKVGDFGKYQVYVFSLLCVLVILRSSISLGYVFTASDIGYR